MKEVQHTCYAPSCRTRIAKRYLFCAQHWARVPGHLRDAVADEWANVQTTGMITLAYEVAVLAAKESLKCFIMVTT